MLTEGALPPAAAVRVEEFVNYFGYELPGAATAARRSRSSWTRRRRRSTPAATSCASASRTQGEDASAERKPANLVFLVDVSGSMQSPGQARAREAVAAHPDRQPEGRRHRRRSSPTPARRASCCRRRASSTRRQILAAIDELTAGGSTAMASGIDLAYEQAMKGLRPGAITRVIVLSDGDANVGPHGARGDPRRSSRAR